MDMNDDFETESKNCFLCSNQDFSGGSVVKTEPGLPALLYSLQCLSRYLKLDMSKVFSQHELIPRHLLEKVESSKLMVPLCTDCANLTERFAALYEHLERIKMEATDLIKMIHDKLKTFNGSSSVFWESCGIEAGGFKGKREIAETLRTEITEICSRKLMAVNPRVKIKNLTMGQVNEETLKIKSFAQDRRKLNRSQKLYPEDLSDPNIEDSTPEVSDDDDEYVANYSDNSGASDDQWEETSASFATDAHSGQDSEVEIGEVKPALPVEIPPQHNDYPCWNKFGKDNSSVNPKTGKVRCKLCGIEFKQQICCNRHLKVVHLGVRKTVKCHLCNQSFSHKPSLYRHHQLKRCNKGRLPKARKVICHCNLCGQGFSRRYNLKHHLNAVHLNLKKWVCNYCGKKFGRIDNLNRHRETVHLKSKVEQKSGRSKST